MFFVRCVTNQIFSSADGIILPGICRKQYVKLALKKPIEWLSQEVFITIIDFFVQNISFIINQFLDLLVVIQLLNT